jgi:molecular chaperone DnaJ
MQTMRKEWVEKDYYATLGVSKDASAADIKKAFRKLARENHPDSNPGDANAETRFKEINEAYDTLSDPEERKEYDHVREMGYFVGAPGGGQQYVRVEDLFGAGGSESPFDLFGGIGDLFGRGGRQAPRARAGRDVTTDITLTFHEALSGATKQIDLGGSTVKVKIPKGVADGTRIRVPGKGEAGMGGGQQGDLYVRVHVAEHPIFKRKGKRDLGVTVPITFAEAALGATIDVPTLDGKTRIRIPPGTQSSQTLRVREKGIETDKGSGDLLVTVEIVIPRELTEEQRGLLEELRSSGSTDNPRAHLGV